MTNPYRSELQLLFDAAESFTEPALGHHRAWEAAMDRARALLAQYEPAELTDEEIEEWYVWELVAADACSEAPLEEMDPEIHGWRRCFTSKEFGETIRAALDRWGNSQGILDSSPQPVAVSERPWERTGWCDEQGRCWLRRKHEEDGVTWRLMVPASVFDDAMQTYYAEALPANDLPTPETTNE